MSEKLVGGLIALAAGVTIYLTRKPQAWLWVASTSRITPWSRAKTEEDREQLRTEYARQQVWFSVAAIIAGVILIAWGLVETLLGG
ncbi:MAG: hypothetical protein PF636_08785 [Actinomycetota bacterium]|nr:hypothetical protein [Actinomycetota bacterium]